MGPKRTGCFGPACCPCLNKSAWHEVKRSDSDRAGEALELTDVLRVAAPPSSIFVPATKTRRGLRAGMLSRKPGNERVSITLKHPGHHQHWAGVEALCFGSTPGTLFTGSRDCSVKAWRQQERDGRWAFAADFEAHTGWVTALVAFPDLLASASYDTTIRLWRPSASSASGPAAVPLTTLRKHEDYVLQLAAAPLAGRFVSAGLRGDLHIWDLETCAPTPVAPNNSGGDHPYAPPPVAGPHLGGRVDTGSIYALDCTPDARAVAFSTANGAVCLYDPRAGAEVARCKGHWDNVRSVRLSSDARRLVTASSDHTVRVWDVAMGACVAALEMHTDSVWSLACDEHMRTVVSGGRDGKVFVTDTAALRTCLLADVGAPVLDLQLGSGDVWVGTTDSEVTCWQLPNSAPDQDVVIHNVSNDTDATNPKHRLPGIPALVRHAVFEDRRHILTLDARGKVSLWDLVLCKSVAVYPGKDFETIYRCLFPGLLSTVPPWFTSDVQQGVLTLHMTYPQAFSAELYAQAIGMACPDDVKLNYGHQLLTAMFTVWRLKCEGRPVDPAILVQTQTPFSALLSAPHLRPSITSTYASSGATWRLDMLDFSGREHEAGMLPAWVQDAVCKGVYEMPHSNLKLSFTLSPAPGSKLPFLSIARLSAPIILEVRKVAQYVEERLAEVSVPVLLSDVTMDAAANEASWRDLQGAVLVITCHGFLVPSSMTLNTIKRYICKGRADDDVPLLYGILDVSAPALPLPSISPKDVPNH